MAELPTPPPGTPMFQITQGDLEELERMLPKLTSRLWPGIDNATKVQIRTVKRIIGDVRWNYGPPDHCEKVD